MSVSASITWTLHKDRAEITWVKIINFMLASGWSINDHGQMTYLPLNDNDMYDWQREPINEKRLFEILSNKESLKEPLGVCITWQNSNIGGALLTLNENELLFSITINRKTIPLCDGKVITDVNWYLLNLNSILSKIQGISIVSTNFDEIL